MLGYFTLQERVSICARVQNKIGVAGDVIILRIWKVNSEVHNAVDH